MIHSYVSYISRIHCGTYLFSILSEAVAAEECATDKGDGGGGQVGDGGSGHGAQTEQGGGGSGRGGADGHGGGDGGGEGKDGEEVML